jgi:site-specific recombinase XerD
MDERGLQWAVKEAVRKVDLAKSASSHILRRSFAMHLLEDGSDIRTLQARLRHRDVSTIMLDTRVLKRGEKRVYRPIDCL